MPIETQTEIPADHFSGGAHIIPDGSAEADLATLLNEHKTALEELDASLPEGGLDTLASTDPGDGASLIGVEDDGDFFTGADVEAVLAEVGTALAATAQRGTGTLVAGTFTVDTTITLTAESKIFLTFAERPSGSTNLACLAVVARTTGAPLTAEFTVEAVLATGAIDVDCVGDVHWWIVD